VDGAPENDVDGDTVSDGVTDWGDGNCSNPLIPALQTQQEQRPFNHPYIQENLSLYQKQYSPLFLNIITLLLSTLLRLYSVISVYCKPKHLPYLT